MTNPHGSFIWYELMSPDPDGSKAFYDAVVGWTIGDPMPGPVDYRIIGRADGGNAGGVLKLDAAMIEHGAKPTWVGYVGVDDVDAAVAAATAAGGSVIMPAWDAAGIGRIAMIRDPQGNPIYLMRPTPPPGDEDKTSDVFSEREPGHVSWNELGTSDPAAARSFYGDLFGWNSDQFMPMGEMGEYRFWYHGETRLGAVCGLMPGSSGGWRYYLRVPSIARSVGAVNAAGGTISMGPYEVPGGDHIIIGKDPQGAEFALVGGA